MIDLHEHDEGCVGLVLPEVCDCMEKRAITVISELGGMLLDIWEMLADIDTYESEYIYNRMNKKYGHKKLDGILDDLYKNRYIRSKSDLNGPP